MAYIFEVSVQKFQPVNIVANREQKVLIINWQDGHQSVYPFSLLRHACPCVECRDGHENMSQEPDPLVFQLPEEDSLATHLKNVEAVGTYALSLQWEDGHRYGIYTWKYLRALCPCVICRLESAHAE